MSQSAYEQVLPYDVSSYQRVAATLSEAEFAQRMPFPFLLFARSTLWDPAFLRERFDRSAAPGATQVVRYDFPTEGGLALVSSVRRRPDRGADDSKAKGIVLGRSTTNDIVVPVASVSSMHCSFGLPTPASGNLWTVTDLESSNHTYVNDVKLASYAPTPIEDGSFMRPGGNLLCYFLYPERLYRLLRNPKELRQLIEV